MKKKILVGLLSLTSLMATDYVLEMNDNSFTISTEKTNTIRLDNKTYKIKLIKKNIQKYISKYVSFNYISKIQPSKQQLSPQLSQIMMATPLGSVILLQEYNIGYLKKEDVFKTMKKVLTKGDIAKGYMVSENKIITKKLQDGTKLIGIKYSITNQSNGKLKKIHKLYFKTTSKNAIFISILLNKINGIEDTNIKDVSEIFWDTLSINL